MDGWARNECGRWHVHNASRGMKHKAIPRRNELLMTRRRPPESRKGSSMHMAVHPAGSRNDDEACRPHLVLPQRAQLVLAQRALQEVHGSQAHALQHRGAAGGGCSGRKEGAAGCEGVGEFGRGCPSWHDHCTGRPSSYPACTAVRLKPHSRTAHSSPAMRTTGACTAAACLKNPAVCSAGSGASNPCSTSTQSNATAPPAKHAWAASTLVTVLTAGQVGWQQGGGPAAKAQAGCRAAALRRRRRRHSATAGCPPNWSRSAR